MKHIGDAASDKLIGKVRPPQFTDRQTFELAACSGFEALKDATAKSRDKESVGNEIALAIDADTDTPPCLVGLKVAKPK